jgi:hypothetical protein
MDKKTESKYHDLIDLAYKKSSKRPKMSLENRAAQFSPFAAVVGHERAVKETARLTDQRRELDEMAKSKVDEKLQIIERNLSSDFPVEIIYFLPDPLKSGGRYLHKKGSVKKIDPYSKFLHMEDGTSIDIEEIYEIYL